MTSTFIAPFHSRRSAEWADAALRVGGYLRAHRIPNSAMLALNSAILAEARHRATADVAPLSAAMAVATERIAAWNTFGGAIPPGSPVVRLSHMVTESIDFTVASPVSVVCEIGRQRAARRLAGGLTQIIDFVKATLSLSR